MYALWMGRRTHRVTQRKRHSVCFSACNYSWILPLIAEEHDHGIESAEDKDPTEGHEEKGGDEIQGLATHLPEETGNNVDSSASFHTEQDQQTYANLEPILVAM